MFGGRRCRWLGKKECLLWAVCVVGVGVDSEKWGASACVCLWVAHRCLYNPRQHSTTNPIGYIRTCGYGETVSELFVIFELFFSGHVAICRCGAVTPCSDNFFETNAIYPPTDDGHAARCVLSLPASLLAYARCTWKFIFLYSAMLTRDLRARHQDAGLPATCSCF